MPSQNITDNHFNENGSLKAGSINRDTTSLEIHTSYCKKISLSGITPQITDILFRFCTNLTSLSDLPKTLEKLNVSYCAQLESLPDFNEGLTVINVTRCEGLTSLPELPKTLKKLNVSYCTQLESLPDFNEGLTVINVSGCRNLTSLPDVPKTLEKLSVLECESLTSLSNFNEGLTEIDVSGCRNLTSLSELPTTLEKLNVLECESLTSLSNFNEGLTEINVADCRNLTSLPVLPKTLKKLNVSYCAQLESLPDFNEGLTKINVSRCINLTSLPKLPESLTYINLEGCRNLRQTPELIIQLQNLEDRGCDIRYPEHFRFSNQSDLAEQKLKQIIAKYNEVNHSNKDSANTIDILHRFLTEGVRARTKSATEKKAAAEIAATVFPILEELEKNPNHLEWVEEIAALFTKVGCVNQPVIGWSEISAWIGVAKEEKIQDKIEAAKYLLTLVYLKEFIARLPQDQKPRLMFEAEAGNALLREVHKELLTKGALKKPWLSVPNLIAHEQGISSWLETPKLINQAVEFIEKKAINIEHGQIVNFLLETQAKDIWCHIIIDKKEIEEIGNKFAKQLEILELFCKSSSKETLEHDELEYLEQLEAGLTSTEEVEYYHHLKSLGEDEALEEQYQKISEARERELSELPSRKTHEILKKESATAIPRTSESEEEGVKSQLKQALEELAQERKETPRKLPTPPVNPQNQPRPSINQAHNSEARPLSEPHLNPTSFP